MYSEIEGEAKGGPPYVSTGHLPSARLVRSLAAEAYERFKVLDEGAVADYIPALARTEAYLFGLCIAGVNGAVHAAGDAEHAFSIQSISKPFVFALVCQVHGAEPVREMVGVKATGLPFNSVMAVEPNASRTMNPMVNAGGGCADARGHRGKNAGRAGDARNDGAGVHTNLRLSWLRNRPDHARTHSGVVPFWPQGAAAARVLSAFECAGSGCP